MVTVYLQQIVNINVDHKDAVSTGAPDSLIHIPATGLKAGDQQWVIPTRLHLIYVFT